MSALDWSAEQVGKWVASLNFHEYCGYFIDNVITGDVLVHMQQSDLRELGIKSVGHRLTILKAIYKLKIEQNLNLEEGDYYVPPTAREQHLRNAKISGSFGSSGAGALGSLGSGGASSGSQGTSSQFAGFGGPGNVDVASIVKAFSIRDERIAATKQELKKLTEAYHRLREDLLPIFRLVKESTPLPNPGAAAALAAATGDNSYYTSYGGSSRPHSTQVSMPVPVSIPSPMPSPSYSPISSASPTTGFSASHMPTPSQSSMGSSNSQLHSSSRPKMAVRPSNMKGSTDWQRSDSSGSTFTISSLANTVESTSTPKDKTPGPLGFSSTPSGPPSTGANSSSAGSGPASATMAVPLMPSSTTNITSAASLSNSAPPKPSTPALTPTTAANVSSSSSSSKKAEPFKKSFRVHMNDPCYKVLPAALKRYRINGDWREYALLVTYDDQERLLDLEDKPLSIFKALADAGKNPVFMLRHIDGSKSYPPSSGGL